MKLLLNFCAKSDAKERKSCRFSKTGSMTGINPCTIGLFGMFDLKEVGLSIVPLKYFHFSENENDAFNYIETRINEGENAYQRINFHNEEL